MIDKLEIFPIGDLHNRTMDEAKVFVEFLDEKSEKLLILLGDIIHFVNSFWSSNLDEMKPPEVRRTLKRDYGIWECFFRGIEKPTIFYLGTHEMFVSEICIIRR